MKTPLPILYEDENCAVINKPDGLMVHADGRSDETTLADVLLSNYPDLSRVGEEGRGGIVHRLDRNTTGVIIVAKNHSTYSSFKRQFKEHTIRKVYRTIVEGNIREDTGMIQAPLARAKSDFRKRTVVDLFSKDMRGKEREAITRYKVLSRSKVEGKEYTYVEVYPLTGRTHQIRAHFRAIRHPIIGDDTYGSTKGKHEAPRSMLHAYSLTVEIPDKGEMSFVAPLPSDMEAALEKLSLLW